MAVDGFRVSPRRPVDGVLGRRDEQTESGASRVALYHRLDRDAQRVEVPVPVIAGGCLDALGQAGPDVIGVAVPLAESLRQHGEREPRGQQGHRSAHALGLSLQLHQVGDERQAQFAARVREPTRRGLGPLALLAFGGEPLLALPLGLGLGLFVHLAVEHDRTAPCQGTNPDHRVVAKFLAPFGHGLADVARRVVFQGAQSLGAGILSRLRQLLLDGLDAQPGQRGAGRGEPFAPFAFRFGFAHRHVPIASAGGFGEPFLQVRPSLVVGDGLPILDGQLGRAHM